MFIVVNTYILRIGKFPNNLHIQTHPKVDFSEGKQVALSNSSLIASFPTKI